MGVGNNIWGAPDYNSIPSRPFVLFQGEREEVLFC